MTAKRHPLVPAASSVAEPDLVAGSSQQGTFTVLEERECHALLLDGVIGRVAFTDPELTILPITYRFVDERIVFKTSTRSSLARLVGREVAFEVDDIDAETGVGWSVLGSGIVETATADQVRDVHPWAAGQRDVALSIALRGLTGRVVSRPEGQPA